MKTTTATIDWRATLTEALNAPGSLGNTYTRFYNYSFLNQIRLMMQGAEHDRAPGLARNCRERLPDHGNPHPLQHCDRSIP